MCHSYRWSWGKLTVSITDYSLHGILPESVFPSGTRPGPTAGFCNLSSHPQLLCFGQVMMSLVGLSPAFCHSAASHGLITWWVTGTGLPALRYLSLPEEKRHPAERLTAGDYTGSVLPRSCSACYRGRWRQRLRTFMSRLHRHTFTSCKANGRSLELSI